MNIAFEVEKAFSDIGVQGAKLSLSNRPDLADYMSDAAFGAAKTLRRSPNLIAEEVVSKLSQDGYTATVVGGFVNIRLANDKIVDLLPNPRNYIRKAEQQTFIVDSGGPNIAKPMHVGHLRSLVIGDSLARILRFLGHRVIKDIHYGDWGFQMGLLIAWEEDATTIEALQEIYPKAAQLAKDDPSFKRKAQRATVALQNGEELALTKWKAMRALTEASVGVDCQSLGVSFDEYLGESDSMPMVPTVADLLSLIESDGAQIVSTSHGPLIFRNSEGGYLYAATDLATIAMRDADKGLHHGLYVVDERQALHFNQVFDAARQFSNSTFEHVAFGTVNGPDGKPFKTRAGGVPKLADLIEEAITKASQRNEASAQAVAIAALKFGDLINRRTGSYSFDIDKALRFEGKTGAYMLYQIARIRSIVKQAQVPPSAIVIADDDMRSLALHLVEFFPTVEKAGETRMPHLVAEYAYEAAQRFSRFYAGEPIKTSPTRLSLAMKSLDVLETAVKLLGIEPVEEM